MVSGVNVVRDAQTGGATDSDGFNQVLLVSGTTRESFGVKHLELWQKVVHGLGLMY